MLEIIFVLALTIFNIFFKTIALVGRFVASGLKLFVILDDSWFFFIIHATGFLYFLENFINLGKFNKSFLLFYVINLISAKLKNFFVSLPIIIC